MPGRPRINGQGRKVKKYARDSATFSKRKAVTDFYRECGSMKETLDHFYSNLTPKSRKSKARSIQRWSKDLPRIERMCASAKGDQCRERQLGEGATLSKETEESIVVWVNLLRKDGVPVSSRMLSSHALNVAADQGLHPPAFTASSQWIKGFLGRHKFAMRARTRQGQTTPAHAQEVLKLFSETLRLLIVESKATKVFNADQTGVFYEYLPRTTVDAKGAKTVWVKCGGKSKERLTAMLLADSDGTKYDPFVVFKTEPSKKKNRHQENKEERNGFGKRLWREMKALQDTTGMQVYGNSTAWWNEDLSLRFLKYHFGDRNQDDHAVILLWDDFTGHWTRKVTDYASLLNVILLKVPPKFTYVCQPADISWNKPLKDKLRHSWLTYVREQVREVQGRQNIKPPSRRDVINWLKEAWQGLSESTIKGGFRQIHVPEDTRPWDRCDLSEDTDSLVQSLQSLRLLDEDVGEIGSDDDLVNE